MGVLHRIDAMGEACPIPVVKAKKALDAAQAGDWLEVLVDNEIAVENVKKLAKSQNCGCKSEILGDKQFSVTIYLGQQECMPDQVPVEEKRRDGGTDYVVVVRSETMGAGDEALGKILMKSFFYALSQSDQLPQRILFYNSGVMVTTQESDTLEDLKAMEKQGVTVLSCGACLDFYGRKDLLLVGSVTNMYEIVETMQRASKVISP